MEIKKQVNNEAKLQNLSFVETLNEEEQSAIRGGGVDIDFGINASFGDTSATLNFGTRSDSSRVILPLPPKPSA